MSRDANEDRLLDHNYDGIQEYDNPMPRWWLWLFWITIGFSLLYALNLPGIGTGKGRIANYERDMNAARAKYGAATAAALLLSDDDLIAISRDAAKLAQGKLTFTTQCVACHRADGGGNIGPNLTDAFWIHGAKPRELLKTVSAGVLEKGMPAWSQVLKPDQVSAVVGYVLTLRGTHPLDPKPPQGIPVDDSTATSGAGTATGTSP